MTADSLLSLLARRHAEDVFVPECKDGPTQTRSHRRLDAWALLKTWSPITTIGYEIKISRADFLKDQKIGDYLPLCHLLYIVTPKSLLKVEELPQHVGLMEPIGSGTAERLVTRRKASYRDIDLPGELLVYVLMCRSKITRDRHDNPEWQRTTLQQWVADKEDRQSLSLAVNEKIKRIFDAQARKQYDLDHRLQGLAHIAERVKELGFDPEQSVGSWQVSNRVKEIAGVAELDPLIRSLDDTLRYIERAKHALEAIRVPSQV